LVHWRDRRGAFFAEANAREIGMYLEDLEVTPL
jgi:hypothetical protein